MLHIKKCEMHKHEMERCNHIQIKNAISIIKQLLLLEN